MSTIILSGSRCIRPSRDSSTLQLVGRGDWGFELDRSVTQRQVAFGHSFISRRPYAKAQRLPIKNKRNYFKSSKWNFTHGPDKSDYARVISRAFDGRSGLNGRHDRGAWV